MKFSSPHIQLVLTWINLAAVAVVFIKLTCPRGDTSVVRAERIELIDQKGTVRGQFNVEEDGEVLLRLRDEAGQVRVKLGASGQGSGLLLLDDKTAPGVQMTTGLDRTTNQRENRIIYWDERGTSRKLTSHLNND